MTSEMKRVAIRNMEGVRCITSAIRGVNIRRLKFFLGCRGRGRGRGLSVSSELKRV